MKYLYIKFIINALFGNVTLHRNQIALLNSKKFLRQKQNDRSQARAQTNLHWRGSPNTPNVCGPECSGISSAISRRQEIPHSHAKSHNYASLVGDGFRSLLAPRRGQTPTQPTACQQMMTGTMIFIVTAAHHNHHHRGLICRTPR